MSRIVTRTIPDQHHATLVAQGLSPLMARLYAARGIAGSDELDYSLKALLPYHSMKNITAMASRLATPLPPGSACWWWPTMTLMAQQPARWR